MKILLTLLLSTATIVRGQSNITSDFTADSLGCNGLRQKHLKQVPFDNLEKRSKDTKSPVQVLFDDKSIIGESKESIISLLGSPNWTSYSKKKQGKNNIGSKTAESCRMNNDTLILVFKAYKKQKKNTEETHYRINTCGNTRRGTTLIIFITDNKVTDAFFETMN